LVWSEIEAGALVTVTGIGKTWGHNNEYVKQKAMESDMYNLYEAKTKR